MAKGPITQQVLGLQAQADATRRVAETAGDATTKSLVSAAAATIESVMRSQLRKPENARPILDLPSTASLAEIKQARRRQAVRHGDDIYLPSWREATIGLPNVLLRSALFGAGRAGDALLNAPIASQGDTVLTMTGPQLGDYDRQIFAICLNYYRADRPLGSATGPKWVKVSFWQMAQDLRVQYGANVHRAIRESLIRLNAAHLRIRIKRQDIPMPRLIEVAFDDGYAGRDTPNHLLRGSDLIAFNVMESMANLFGPAAWSAVSKAALFEYSGLQSWLTTFYNTHAGPYPRQVKDLYQYSGSKCDLREFRRRLKVTLTKLQSDEVDAEVRIAWFVLDKVSLTVNLLRWEKG